MNYSPFFSSASGFIVLFVSAIPLDASFSSLLQSLLKTFTFVVQLHPKVFIPFSEVVRLFSSSSPPFQDVLREIKVRPSVRIETSVKAKRMFDI